MNCKRVRTFVPVFRVATELGEFKGLEQGILLRRPVDIEMRSGDKDMVKCSNSQSGIWNVNTRKGREQLCAAMRGRQDYPVFFKLTIVDAIDEMMIDSPDEFRLKLDPDQLNMIHDVVKESEEEFRTGKKASKDEILDDKKDPSVYPSIEEARKGQASSSNARVGARPEPESDSSKGQSSSSNARVGARTDSNAPTKMPRAPPWADTQDSDSERHQPRASTLPPPEPKGDPKGGKRSRDETPPLSDQKREARKDLGNRYSSRLRIPNCLVPRMMEKN